MNTLKAEQTAKEFYLDDYDEALPGYDEDIEMAFRFAEKYHRKLVADCDISNAVGRSVQLCDHDFKPCSHEAVAEFDVCSKCGKID